MRVLYLADINSVHFRRWAQALQERGVHAGVYSLAAPADDWHTKTGITILSDVSAKPSSKWAYFLKAGDVRKAVETFKPDLVHAHYASSYGMLAREAGFHPCIVSVWGSDVLIFPKQFFINKRILKKNLAFANAILATGNSLKKATLAYTKKNVELTPFGVDTSVFKPLPTRNTEVFTVACAKALEPVYGIDLLIKLIGKIHAVHGHIRLKLAGDGSCKEEYKNLVNHLGLSAVVEFSGKLTHTEVATFYATSNAAVFLSESESFGVSVLEASACALPVICSLAGGFTDVVKNGITGYCLNRHNEAELTARIIELMENKQKATEMGVEGRKFVQETYEWSACVDTMLEIYNRVKDS